MIGNTRILISLSSGQLLRQETFDYYNLTGAREPRESNKLVAQ